jgi:hypothetical protein
LPFLILNYDLSKLGPSAPSGAHATFARQV